MANKYSKRHTKQNALGNETEQASLALTVEVRKTITGNHFSSHQSLSQYVYLKVLLHINVSVCFFFSLFIRSIKDKAKWRWSLGQHGRASGGKCVCWFHTCGPGEVWRCRLWWFCVLGCWHLSGSSMCLYPFTAGTLVRLDSFMHLEFFQSL